MSLARPSTRIQIENMRQRRIGVRFLVVLCDTNLFESFPSESSIRIPTEFLVIKVTQSLTLYVYEELPNGPTPQLLRRVTKSLNVYSAITFANETSAIPITLPSAKKSITVPSSVRRKQATPWNALRGSRYRGASSTKKFSLGAEYGFPEEIRERAGGEGEKSLLVSRRGSLKPERCKKHVPRLNSCV